MADDDIILTNAPLTGAASPFDGKGIELPDNDPIVQKLGLAKGQPEPQGEVKKEEVPATQADPKQEAQPAATPDGTQKVEAKPEKVPYTEEELKSLVNDPRFEKGEIHLDTSRLRDADRAMYTEFQRGMTKKREKELAEIKAREDALQRRQAEIAAVEERMRQAEAERKYREDIENLGQEEADRRKKDAEIEARLIRLENEKRALEQKVLADKFKQAYVEVAPKYNLPNTQEIQDATFAYVWAQNLERQSAGLPMLTIEDGAAAIAEQFGFSSYENLEKIINANPKNREALEQKIIADYLKKKNAGPTPAQTIAGVATEKPSEKTEDKIDMDAFSKDPSAALLARVTARFEKDGLKLPQ